MGVEIEENSELDLFEAFHKHDGDPRIPDVVKDMEAELGAGNQKPEVLPKLAQYELTLLDWIEAHKGYRRIRGDCRKVLASIPDSVWFCSMLCQQPSHRKRNPSIMRGRYLRSIKRVYRRMCQPGRSDTA